MINVAIISLSIVAILTAVAGVAAVWVVSRSYERITNATLKHLENTQVIGGTPSGLAKTQTEFQQRMQEEDAKAMRDAVRNQHLEPRDILG